MARILIIEDELEVRRLLSSIIEAAGHEVLEAGTAQEGLGRVEQRPDAILVDVNLPGMSGAQFVLKLRQHLTAAGTPVMFVTAYQDRIYPILAAGLAERHVVDKPFRRGDVLDALGRMLTANMNRRNRRIRLQPNTVTASVGESSFVVKDLSVGGARLAGNTSFDAEQEITVKLSYEGQNLSVPASIGHVHTDGIGCRFRELDGDTRAQIGRLVERLISEKKVVPEKIRARRTRLEVPALVEHSSEMSNVLLRNISATGAFVEGKVKPQAASSIAIYIPYEEGESLQEDSPRVTSTEARVVRHTDRGFGCEFIDPSPAFRKAVFDLMSSE